MEDKERELIGEINFNIQPGEIPDLIQDHSEVRGSSTDVITDTKTEVLRKWQWPSPWYVPSYRHSKKVECRRSETNFIGPYLSVFRDLEGKIFFQLAMFLY